MPEFRALNGFSDSLATSKDHWETRLEEVTRHVANWFSGLRTGEARLGRDYQQRDQSNTAVIRDHMGILCGQIGIVTIHFVI